MPIFVDTSNLEELQSCVAMGLCAGVTTNPLILARECPDVDLGERIRAIVELAKVPTSVELTTETEHEMLEESRGYHAWAPEHIVIKVPLTEVGLRVTRALEVKHRIPVNMTCMMSFNQAYLAAHSGASYVSLFSGRIRDMGYQPGPIIEQLRGVLDRERSKAQIIVGSIRHLGDVNEALAAGAHIVTVPPSILRKMLWNPRTDETIKEFNDAWAKRRK